MTRPYSPYDTTQTERFGDQTPEPGRSRGPDAYPGLDSTGYQAGGYAGSEYRANAADSEDYDDFVGDVEFYEEPIDRRWVWVAAVAGAILLVAVICTVVILGGSDSGSVSATVAAPAPSTSQPAPAPHDVSPTTNPRPAPSELSPETVTTVTPAPTATAAPAPVPAPPAQAAAPAPDPRTITYRVTGNRQLIDLVTVVYTDQRGALQTDINVALPWAKTVVLDPGVELKSVTATSVAGQLNCSISDAAGAVIVQQTNNTMISTCTQ